MGLIKYIPLTLLTFLPFFKVCFHGTIYKYIKCICCTLRLMYSNLEAPPHWFFVHWLQKPRQLWSMAPWQLSCACWRFSHGHQQFQLTQAIPIWWKETCLTAQRMYYLGLPRMLLWLLLPHCLTPAAFASAHWPLPSPACFEFVESNLPHMAKTCSDVVRGQKTSMLGKLPPLHLGTLTWSLQVPLCTT